MACAKCKKLNDRIRELYDHHESVIQELKETRSERDAAKAGCSALLIERNAYIEELAELKGKVNE